MVFKKSSLGLSLEKIGGLGLAISLQYCQRSKIIVKTKTCMILKLKSNMLQAFEMKNKMVNY